MSNADNQLKGAKNLGLLRSSISRRDRVGLTDRDDLYRFRLNQRSRLNLTLTKQGKGGCAVELYALKRPLDRVLRQIGQLDFRKIGRKALTANLQRISASKLGDNQNAGTYFIRVLQRAGNSRYRLQLATASGVDTKAPTANLLTINPSTRDVTVVYRDNVALNAGSIDDNDLRITGPGGTQLVTRVIANDSSGSTRTVTYRMTPPGGGWDNADNGNYSIALQAKQVSDSSGNFAAANLLGTLTVNIPPRSGNGYSITGVDETRIEAQFKLFSTLPDATPIADQAASNTVGLFTGAVGDFISGSGRLTSLLNPQVGSFTADNQVSVSDLNLRAELVNYNPVAQTGTLEYRIFRKPVNEFQPGVDETLFGLRFTIDASFAQNFDLNRAVNSLDYIIANNLFGDGTGTNKPSGIGFSDNSILGGRDIAGGTVLTSNF